MSDGLEERLRRIVVNYLGVRPDQVKRTAAFFEDLGADSLDLIELIMMVEEELCISIPERNAERMTTFGHMLDYIDRQSGYRPWRISPIRYYETMTSWRF